MAHRLCVLVNVFHRTFILMYWAYSVFERELLGHSVVFVQSLSCVYSHIEIKTRQCLLVYKKVIVIYLFFDFNSASTTLFLSQQSDDYIPSCPPTTYSLIWSEHFIHADENPAPSHNKYMGNNNLPLVIAQCKFSASKLSKSSMNFILQIIQTRLTQRWILWC